MLQAWGRLCKCLGADFLPYLSVSMPVVLKSSQLKNYLSVSNDSDTEDSDSDDERLNLPKTLGRNFTYNACHMC